MLCFFKVFKEYLFILTLCYFLPKPYSLVVCGKPLLLQFCMYPFLKITLPATYTCSSKGGFSKIFVFFADSTGHFWYIWRMPSKSNCYADSKGKFAPHSPCSTWGVLWLGADKPTQPRQSNQVSYSNVTVSFSLEKMFCD